VKPHLLKIDRKTLLHAVLKFVSFCRDDFREVYVARGVVRDGDDRATDEWGFDISAAKSLEGSGTPRLQTYLT
jgi:hypothetical protein